MSQVSPQATGYLAKCTVDSIVTDGATSSGPHGISLSTTMDDDVFMDGTLREAEEKTPESQDEVSERSMVKVSPGSVRQEVSQAISDKKGTLIILKEAEDIADTECEEMSVLGEEEEPVVPREGDEEFELLSPSKKRETVKEDAAVVIDSQTTVVKTLSPKIEIKTDNTTQIKGTDSPKKAMASWISEEVKTEASKVIAEVITEVIAVSAKEVKEPQASAGLQREAEAFASGEAQTEQSKPSLTQITVSESSTTSLAVVLYEKLKKTPRYWLPPLHVSTAAPKPFPHRLPSSSSQTSLTTV